MSRRGFSVPPEDDSPNSRDGRSIGNGSSPVGSPEGNDNGSHGSFDSPSPNFDHGALPPPQRSPGLEGRRERQTNNGRGPTPQTVPMHRSQAPGRMLQKILDNQHEILKRVAKVERQLDHLQSVQNSKQRQAGKQNKPTVPNDVRNMVKEGYDHCVNTDGREKWNLAKGMKATSAPNDETTKAVLGYVQGLLPGYADKMDIVKAAVDTYFDSKRRGEMREQTGKTNKHRKQCVRNTRIATKLDHRLKALKAKKSYNTQLKLKLQRVLTKEFMSSDESDTDDNGEKIFLTKTIPWQSDTLTKYKRELDQKYLTAIQSEQAKRQSIKRVPGPPSTSKSKKPILSEEDTWIAK